jgi:hypothetical protein
VVAQAGVLLVVASEALVLNRSSTNTCSSIITIASTSASEATTNKTPACATTTPERTSNYEQEQRLQQDNMQRLPVKHCMLWLLPDQPLPPQQQQQQ